MLSESILQPPVGIRGLKKQQKHMSDRLSGVRSPSARSMKFWLKKARKSVAFRKRRKAQTQTELRGTMILAGSYNQKRDWYPERIEVT